MLGRGREGPAEGGDDRHVLALPGGGNAGADGVGQQRGSRYQHSRNQVMDSARPFAVCHCTSTSGELRLGKLCAVEALDCLGRLLQDCMNSFQLKVALILLY